MQQPPPCVRYVSYSRKIGNWFGVIPSLLTSAGTWESNQLMSTSAAVNPNTEPVFPKLRDGLSVCSAFNVVLSSRCEFGCDATVPQKLARWYASIYCVVPTFTPPWT